MKRELEEQDVHANVQIPATAAHFCRGTLDVAFVFSVPGSFEQDAAAPTSGVTGEHLSLVLQGLNCAFPEIFPSLHRYDYRITNAFPTPLAKKLGHSRTEARNAEVTMHSNQSRILHELSGVRLVILCGAKARLLEPVLGGRALVMTGHLSQAGLNTRWPTRVLGVNARSRSSEERKHLRLRQWEQEVIAQVGALVRAGRL